MGGKACGQDQGKQQGLLMAARKGKLKTKLATIFTIA